MSLHCTPISLREDHKFVNEEGSDYLGVKNRTDNIISVLVDGLFNRCSSLQASETLNVQIADEFNATLNVFSNNVHEAIVVV